MPWLRLGILPMSGDAGSTLTTVGNCTIGLWSLPCQAMGTTPPLPTIFGVSNPRILHYWNALFMSDSPSVDPVMENKAEEPDFEPSQRNPLYNISAALSYTTQMLNVLAHFLNINLPHKLCYRSDHASVSPSPSPWVFPD